MKTVNAKRKKEPLHPLLRKKVDYAKVMRMLRKWEKEDAKNPEKSRAEWELIKKGIEENRLSDRPRFDH